MWNKKKNQVAIALDSSDKVCEKYMVNSFPKGKI